MRRQRQADQYATTGMMVTTTTKGHPMTTIATEFDRVAEQMAEFESKAVVKTQAGVKRYKLPIGSQIGKSRGTQQANDVQKNPAAKAAYDSFMKLDNAGDMATTAGKLNDDDLSLLSEILFSFRSSNARVVAARNSVVGEMKKRGIDPSKHGYLGGGSRTMTPTAKTAAPTARRATPARSMRKPVAKPAPKPAPSAASRMNAQTRTANGVAPSRTATHRGAVGGAHAYAKSFEDDIETKAVHHVRTPAGVKRFKQPIGSVIVRDSALKHVKALGEVEGYPGWTKVKGSDGKTYEVGKDEGKWVATPEGEWDAVVSAKNEEGVYQALDARVSAATKPPVTRVGKDRMAAVEGREQRVRAALMDGPMTAAEVDKHAGHENSISELRRMQSNKEVRLSENGKYSLTPKGIRNAPGRAGAETPQTGRASTGSGGQPGAGGGHVNLTAPQSRALNTLAANERGEITDGRSFPHATTVQQLADAGLVDNSGRKPKLTETGRALAMQPQGTSRFTPTPEKVAAQITHNEEADQHRQTLKAHIAAKAPQNTPRDQMLEQAGVPDNRAGRDAFDSLVNDGTLTRSNRTGTPTYSVTSDPHKGLHVVPQGNAKTGRSYSVINSRGEEVSSRHPTRADALQEIARLRNGGEAPTAESDAAATAKGEYPFLTLTPNPDYEGWEDIQGRDGKGYGIGPSDENPNVYQLTPDDSWDPIMEGKRDELLRWLNLEVAKNSPDAPSENAPTTPETPSGAEVTVNGLRVGDIVRKGNGNTAWRVASISKLGHQIALHKASTTKNTGGSTWQEARDYSLHPDDPKSNESRNRQYLDANAQRRAAGEELSLSTHPALRNLKPDEEYGDVGWSTVEDTDGNTYGVGPSDENPDEWHVTPGDSWDQILTAASKGEALQKLNAHASGVIDARIRRDQGTGDISTVQHQVQQLEPGDVVGITHASGKVEAGVFVDHPTPRSARFDTKKGRVQYDLGQLDEVRKAGGASARAESTPLGDDGGTSPGSVGQWLDRVGATREPGANPSNTKGVARYWRSGTGDDGWEAWEPEDESGIYVRRPADPNSTMFLPDMVDARESDDADEHIISAGDFLESTLGFDEYPVSSAPTAEDELRRPTANDVPLFGSDAPTEPGGTAARAARIGEVTGTTPGSGSIGPAKVTVGPAKKSGTRDVTVEVGGKQYHQSTRREFTHVVTMEHTPAGTGDTGHYVRLTRNPESAVRELNKLRDYEVSQGHTVGAPQITSMQATVGRADNGAFVDESRRAATMGRDFTGAGQMSEGDVTRALREATQQSPKVSAAEKRATQLAQQRQEHEARLNAPINLSRTPTDATDAARIAEFERRAQPLRQASRSGHENYNRGVRDDLQDAIRRANNGDWTGAEYNLGIAERAYDRYSTGAYGARPTAGNERNLAEIGREATPNATEPQRAAEGAVEARLRAMSDEELVRADAELDFGIEDGPGVDRFIAARTAEQQRRGIVQHQDLQPGDVFSVDLGKGRNTYRMHSRDDSGRVQAEPINGGPLSVIPARDPRNQNKLWGPRDIRRETPGLQSEAGMARRGSLRGIGRTTATGVDRSNGQLTPEAFDQNIANNGRAFASLDEWRKIAQHLDFGSAAQQRSAEKRNGHNRIMQRIADDPKTSMTPGGRFLVHRSMTGNPPEPQKGEWRMSSPTTGLQLPLPNWVSGNERHTKAFARYLEEHPLINQDGSELRFDTSDVKQQMQNFREANTGNGLGPAWQELVSRFNEDQIAKREARRNR